MRVHAETGVMDERAWQYIEKSGTQIAPCRFKGRGEDGTHIIAEGEPWPGPRSCIEGESAASTGMCPSASALQSRRIGEPTTGAVKANPGLNCSGLTGVSDRIGWLLGDRNA